MKLCDWKAFAKRERRLVPLKMESKFCFDARMGLHWLGAVILLIFGGAKLAMVTEDHSFLHLQNAVFPFFSNRTVLLVAILLEFLAAIFVIKEPKSLQADMWILFIVFSAIWYRIGMFFFAEGVSECGCLGSLRKVLHLEEYQESIVALIAMIILAGCAAPGIYQRFLKMANCNNGGTS
jgi:hypothetical protein